MNSKISLQKIWEDLRSDRQAKLQWFAALILGLIYIIATTFIPGPDDLFKYYLPFAAGCRDCGFVPYYAQWFLWPLTILPREIGWPAWTLFTLIVVYAIHYLRKTNPVPVLLTFPMMAQFWLGQIDALVALGLAMVMGLLGKRPVIKGVGILMALIKPQISLPVIIIMIWYWNWEERLQIGAVVGIGFAASLIQYGLRWPLEWFDTARSLGLHLWRQPATLFFPFGLISLVSVFIISGSSKKIQVALVSSAFIPQHSIYSHLVFLLFMKPTAWWVVPVSWLWLIFVPMLGSNATTISMLLPLAVLLKMIWDQRLEMRESEKKTH